MMDEKLIIKSSRKEFRNTKKLLKAFIIVFIIFVILFIAAEIWWNTSWNAYWTEGGYLGASFRTEHSMKNAHIFLEFSVGVGILAGVLFIPNAIIWLINHVTRNTEITVTDKRVYGIGKFQKRVDLPLDSISAVGTLGKSSIAVSTSSGRIVFSLLDNRDAVHKAISDLLINRQSKQRSEQEQSAQPAAVSNADELIKYKELLDNGVITQEEFDKKKAQLLGL